MFVEGTLRWQVTEDCPWDLLMALCLRDLAGLTDVGDPVLPPVVPAVARQEPTTTARAPRSRDAVVGVDRAVLATQWASWWNRTTHKSLHPLASSLKPPHFAVFDRELALQDLVIQNYDAALTWTAARHEEYVASSVAQHAARAADIVDVVRDREHELRRQAGYFRIDISVLPFAKRGAWIIGPNSIAVSQTLRDDSAAFRAWFAPLVSALV
jgi:hypothetical protein